MSFILCLFIAFFACAQHLGRHAMEIEIAATNGHESGIDHEWQWEYEDDKKWVQYGKEVSDAINNNQAEVCNW